MDDELLIQYVQEFVEMYDYSHPKYCDGGHRTQLWLHIAKKLRQDPSKCKARWESLRSQFRKQLRRHSAKGKDTALVRWRFAEQLQFLLPYMKEKSKKQLNVTSNPLAIQKDNGGFSPEYMEDELEEANYSYGTWAAYETDRMTPEPSQSSELADNVPKVTRRPTIKSELSEPTSSGVHMMKHFLDTAEHHSSHEESVDEMDEIDHFFASMKATVKTFSQANKVLAKREIFHVINDIEMGMFQQNPLGD